MNITHHYVHKYVQNPLFNSQDKHELEDYTHYKRENKNSCKPNNTHIYQAQPSHSYEQKRIFTDLTNERVQNSAEKLLNPAKTKLIPAKTKQNPSKKELIQTTQLILQSVLKDQFSELSKQKQNCSSPNRKFKAKKKVSPRKNNLKQLFLEIDDKCQDGQSNKRQENLKQIQIKNGLKAEKMQESQDFQNEKQIMDNYKQKEYKASLQTEQGQQYEKNEINLSAPNLNFGNKMNKFHFLHDQLNLESSSSEQDFQNEINVKRSSSSENQELKICFQIPKIRSRNNFFIKDEDFQDSIDSQQGVAHSHQENKLQEQNQDNPDRIKKQNPLKRCQIISKILTVSDFRRDFVSTGQEYLKKPLPSNVSIQLILKRDKSKRRSEHIEYYLYDAKSLKQLLLIFKKSSHYQIHAKTNVQNSRAHPDLKYLSARLQSTFLGNEFSLKYTAKNNQQKEQLAATVSYETNILGFGGPRKINIYIPNGEQTKYYGQKSLETLYQKKCLHKISRYTNKQAKWNQEVQSYVLNLKGKAKLSSVKNFVIVKDPQCLKQEKTNSQSSDEQKGYIVFGKSGKDLFNLVVSGPFSILQGISVALSTFQRKLTCQ